MMALEKAAGSAYILLNTASPSASERAYGLVFFCLPSMPPVHYRKPYVDIADQVALLRQRGMAITDADKAASYLERIGYYRLSGYWYPMRDVGGPTNQRQVLDTFRPGTTFAHIVELYVFDKRLRLLFLDAIERIEVGLRVDIALLLGARDPWAHRDPAQLDGRFARNVNPRTGQTAHARWLEKLDELAVRSREDFARHFRMKYVDPLPIWMAIELWDFGMLSTFLSGMGHRDQQALCAKYGLYRRELLTTWVRSINHVRNICAHHSRLWNRSPADQPKVPRIGEVPLLDHLAGDTFAQVRMYAVAATIQYLLRYINPSTSWPRRLRDVLTSFPQISARLSITRTGFPRQWHRLPLWQ